MLSLKPVLEAIEGLIRHTESELERLQEELARLKEDRNTILQYLEATEAAREVAQRYGEEPVPEAVQRFAEGIVPAFTKFLAQAWQEGRTFPSRVALAKAAVTDPEIGKRYSSWRSLAKPDLLNKLFEEVKLYLPYFFGSDVDSSKEFLRYLENLRSGFPPLKAEEKREAQAKKGVPVPRPDWYRGLEDPLHRLEGGGRTAALAFEAMLPVTNGRCDYDHAPRTQEELVDCMRRINKSTGEFLRRIEVMKYGFVPLDKALQAAIEGDLSLLGEERVKRITRVWGFASVEAFYLGHFVPLMQGREVSRHRPSPLEIDPEKHLAVAGID